MVSDHSKGSPALIRRVVVSIVAFIVLALLCVWLTNLVIVGRPLQAAMLKDTRNAGIRTSAHLQHFVNLNVLVFNLQGVSAQNSRLDALRVFLLFAEQEKTRKFTAVQLECQGQSRFILKGDYFQQLGREYQDQNPVYTIRTLAENVYNLDGRAAFGPSGGGLAGLTDELTQFTNFMDSWCFRILAKQLSN